jgi:hypothetical protein
VKGFYYEKDYYNIIAGYVASYVGCNGFSSRIPLVSGAVL